MADGQPDIVIRPGDAGDVDTLAGIGRTSFLAAYGESSNEADLAAHVASHFSPAAVEAEIGLAGQGYLVATVNGVPAGLAKWREGPCPDPVPEPESIEIQQLYVLPDMQRHGLGARLVDRVAGIGGELSARGIWLSVWEQADWATRFYEKIGFSPVGKAEFRVGSTLYTDLLMWLPLPESA